MVALLIIENTKGDDAAPVASSPSAYCFVCLSLLSVLR